MKLQPIGIIHTPFATPEGMPIQPTGGAEITGRVEVFAEFAAGLKDLNGFSHLILLYLFDRSKGFSLEVTPFMDTEPRGLFATRAPRRPNPIGLSVVRLTRVDKNILSISNVDILDQTPLLDIKPYVPDFDGADTVRTGWLEEARKTVEEQTSDNRFSVQTDDARNVKK